MKSKLCPGLEVISERTINRDGMEVAEVVREVSLHGRPALEVAWARSPATAMTIDPGSVANMWFRAIALLHDGEPGLEKARAEVAAVFEEYWRANRRAAEEGRP